MTQKHSVQSKFRVWMERGSGTVLFLDELEFPKTLTQAEFIRSGSAETAQLFPKSTVIAGIATSTSPVPPVPPPPPPPTTGTTTSTPCPGFANTTQTCTQVADDAYSTALDQYSQTFELNPTTGQPSGIKVKTQTEVQNFYSQARIAY